MKRAKPFVGLISSLSAVLLFLISLLINWSSFFPSLGEINPWDESVYVQAGQSVLLGNWPNFAGSPFTAGFYAITNLIFKASPFWLAHSVAAGRLVAYALIWLSAFLIGKQLRPHSQPLVLMFMLLAAPFYIKMLRFPSDPFFLAFSGFGLWQLLEFHQTLNLRNAILAGLFIAMAAAARNDGLILFAVALVWIAGMSIIKKANSLAILGLAIPFALIVGGYTLFHGFHSGTFELGTAERTYDNFEAGQIAVYGGEEGLNAAVDAKREAQRIFGTAAENDYSVFKAILRNPPAYFDRLKRVALELPKQIIKAYSGKWVVVLAFWTIWGLVVLLLKREWSLLALLSLWITPFISGFIITIFRTGHLLFPSLVIISFAAIGLMDFALRCSERKVYLSGLIAMLLALMIGIITSEPVVTYAAGLSVAAMLLIRLGQVVFPGWSQRNAYPLILLFLVGLILHGPFPFLGERPIELPVEERAMLAMAGNLPTRARVLAGSPGVVYAAKMTYMGLSSTDVPVFSTTDAFKEWLKSQAIDGIYIDESMTTENQAYWALLQELAVNYDVVFKDIERGIQVWVRRK
jgi:hypothetical protein